MDIIIECSELGLPNNIPPDLFQNIKEWIRIELKLRDGFDWMYIAPDIYNNGFWFSDSTNASAFLLYWKGYPVRIPTPWPSEFADTFSNIEKWLEENNFGQKNSEWINLAGNEFWIRDKKKATIFKLFWG